LALKGQPIKPVKPVVSLT